MADQERMREHARQLDYLFYEGWTPEQWEEIVNESLKGVELPKLKFPDPEPLPPTDEIVKAAEEFLRQKRK